MTTQRLVRRAPPLLLIALLVLACAPGPEPTVPVGVSTAGTISTTPTAQAPTPTLPKVPSSANEVLAAGRAPFDACYAMARKANSNLGHTNVSITFTMDDQAKLLSVDLTYRNRMDDAAKECMRAAAEALKFPPSLHGTQVGVVEFTPPTTSGR